MTETWCYEHFLCLIASSRWIALCTPNCKSLWIKASAKWLNVNVKCSDVMSIWAHCSAPEDARSTITSPEDSEASLSLTRRQRSKRRAVKSALVVSNSVVLEDPTLMVSSPVVLEDPTPVVSSLLVLEYPTPVVSSPLVLEDPTPVVSSPGILEDLTTVVSSPGVRG